MEKENLNADQIIEICKEIGTPIKIERPYGLTDESWDYLKTVHIIQIPADRDKLTDINWLGTSYMEKGYLFIVEGAGSQILYHELGHMLDFKYKLRYELSLGNLYMLFNQQIAEGFLKPIRHFKHYPEFIAQAIGLYLSSPITFIDTFPSIYVVLERLGVVECVNNKSIKEFVDNYDYLFEKDMLHEKLESVLKIPIDSEDLPKDSLRVSMCSNFTRALQQGSTELIYRDTVLILFMCLPEGVFNKYKDSFDQNVVNKLDKKYAQYAYNQYIAKQQRGGRSNGNK